MVCQCPCATPAAFGGSTWPQRAVEAHNSKPATHEYNLFTEAPELKDYGCAENTAAQTEKQAARCNSL